MGQVEEAGQFYLIRGDSSSKGRCHKHPRGGAPDAEPHLGCISALSHHISEASQPNFTGMSAVCQLYLNCISAVSQPHLSRITAVSQVYLSCILGIYQTYLRRISGVSQAYLRHSSGISQVYIWHILGKS